MACATIDSGQADRSGCVPGPFAAGDFNIVIGPHRHHRLKQSWFVAGSSAIVNGTTTRRVVKSSGAMVGP